MTNFGAPVINKKGNNAFRNLLTSTNSFATFIRGAGGTLGVQIVSAGLLFSSQMLFARLLGVESYGVYAIAFAWMQILLLAGRQCHSGGGGGGSSGGIINRRHRCWCFFVVVHALKEAVLHNVVGGK